MTSKINYKLVNILMVVLIIYLLYQTSSFWIGIVATIWSILFPFLIAFVIAYALTPLVNFLRNKNISKGLSIFLVLAFVTSLFVFLLCLITPVFIEQITSLFEEIISFFKELSLRHNLDFNTLQSQLSSTFDGTVEKLGTVISNGAINIIGISVSIISKFFIVIAALVYFLIDMDKIRDFVRVFALKRGKKIYNYLSMLDDELENYLSGFVKIAFISFFEYSILYMIIGHPNALMLGTLASVGNLIPYFGGIITNIIAAITAFVISPELFLKTCIVFMIFSAVDGYLINPLVYGKSNQVHPLVVIISIFAGGILWGIIGIIIALPTAIILIATYKFFKEDIKKDIEKFNNKKNKTSSKAK